MFCYVVGKAQKILPVTLCHNIRVDKNMTTEKGQLKTNSILSLEKQKLYCSINTQSFPFSKLVIMTLDVPAGSHIYMQRRQRHTPMAGQCGCWLESRWWFLVLSLANISEWIWHPRQKEPTHCQGNDLDLVTSVAILIHLGHSYPRGWWIWILVVERWIVFKKLQTSPVALDSTPSWKRLWHC